MVEKTTEAQRRKNNLHGAPLQINTEFGVRLRLEKSSPELFPPTSTQTTAAWTPDPWVNALSVRSHCFPRLAFNLQPSAPKVIKG